MEFCHTNISDGELLDKENGQYGTTGDIDGSGVINASDIAMFRRLLLTGTDPYCDASGNGAVFCNK